LFEKVFQFQQEHGERGGRSEREKNKGVGGRMNSMEEREDEEGLVGLRW
jgi:hypothetical protein